MSNILSEIIATFFGMNTPRAVILLIVIFFSFPISARAHDFQGCRDCHEATLAEEMTRIYLHSPFSQQQCGKCHAAESTASLENKASTGLKDQQKVHWLEESFMADTSHGFVFANGEIGSTLTVEVKGKEGPSIRREIDVPPLADLHEVEDSGKSPTISEIQVLEVRRGIFLSATIGWRTDTLTDARVRYGEKDLSETSQTNNRFGRRHRVTLYNLKPDRTYRFSSVSNDLFGRVQTSEPLTFTTSSPSTAPERPTPKNPPESREETGMISRFQRLGNNYLFELTLEQPSSIYVGTKEVTRNEQPSGESDGATAEIKAHAGLTSKQTVSLEACRSCHRQQTTTTHPVNVYPKEGMIIPPEYPTLPDGRITCRSCHDPHGSDHEYLTIKGGRRELCVGCHRDMI